MRRILIAALFALGLHGLFLSIKTDRFTLTRVQPLRSEPISLTFSYMQPESRPKPVLRIPERPREKPKPVEKIPEKRQPEKKPEKKRTAPVKKKPSDLKPVIPGPPEPFHSVEPVSPSPVDASNQEPVKIEIKEALKGVKPVEEGTPQRKIGLADSPPPPSLKEAIPMYKENPLPEYPRAARRRGYEGTVILEVLVNRDGSVDDLHLHLSSGHASLDRAAITSVRNWLFEPAKRGEQNVEMWVKVPVRFELK